MVECQSCGGTYEPLLPDGLEYYHVCPPLSVPELRDLVAAKRVVFAPLDQARVDAAHAADLLTPPKPGEPSQVDLVLATFTVERPHKRDDRVKGGRGDDRNDARAAGAGVLEVASPVDPSPVIVDAAVSRDAVQP